MDIEKEDDKSKIDFSSDTSKKDIVTENGENSSLSPNLDHSDTLHKLPDESLADLLPVAKKVAIATGAEQYNILQNNGRLAHQEVEHVHIHVIPKPNEKEGLKIEWPLKSLENGEAIAQEMIERLKASKS
ncbi:11658_t:CDS:2 [Acaulospora colombiana]|uniref:11658_t:CDS:1 n=1 Tax=Acaulospora colombiana TaxID=27376 RepID=A0ACA9K9M5_9GLOM|nr:11658_t:CDS:2 [Acaulospora colombiana]